MRSFNAESECVQTVKPTLAGEGVDDLFLDTLLALGQTLVL